MTSDIYFPPELTKVCRRIIWFEEPEEALRNPHHFLCYLMQNGTDRDVLTAQHYFSDMEFRAALDIAPAGILDARSWAYWNLMLNDMPERSMPERFPEEGTPPTLQ